MCRCTPEIRTPFCGKVGCETPEQTNKLEQTFLDLTSPSKLEMHGLDWTNLAGIQGLLEGLAIGIEMSKGDVRWEGVVEGLRKSADGILIIRQHHKPKF
jgi:hypothetical protein